MRRFGVGRFFCPPLGTAAAVAPQAPPGFAFVTFNGEPVTADGQPVIAPVES